MLLTVAEVDMLVIYGLEGSSTLESRPIRRKSKKAFLGEAFSTTENKAALTNLDSTANGKSSKPDQSA